MKIAKSQLRKIIKEEAQKVLLESWADMLGATKELKRQSNILSDFPQIPALFEATSTDPAAFVNWMATRHQREGNPDPDIVEILDKYKLGKAMQEHIALIAVGDRKFSEDMQNDLIILEKIIDDEDVEGYFFVDELTSFIQEILFENNILTEIKKGYIEP